MPIKGTAARWVTMTLALLAAAATMGPGAAIAESHHGYRVRVIRAPGHNVHCPGRVEINAINDAGEMVGSAGCRYHSLLIIDRGRTTVTRLPSGKLKDDDGAGVASNGLVAATTANYRDPFYSFTSWLRYPGGKLERLTAPRAYRGSTQVFAVNRHGAAVGRYPTTGHGHPDVPFIYRSHGHRRGFTTFHLGIPHATDVELSGINDRGDLCGAFLDKADVHRGFIRHDGHIRVVTAPGASHERFKGTYVDAIANDGRFAASVNPARRPDQTESLVHNRRGWTTIPLPHPGSRLYSTSDINSAGVAVTNYLTAGGLYFTSLKATPAR